jgi:hypothetical protein
VYLVTATGQPRNLEFAIVNGREVIPAGAQIYAIFSGEYAFEQLDEHLFDAMTDEEYFTFRTLAQDAREREARRWQSPPASLAKSLLGKLRQWLLRRRLAAYLSGQSLSRGAVSPEPRADLRSA